jgi:hypothetical protein
VLVGDGVCQKNEAVDVGRAQLRAGMQYAYLPGVCAAASS